MKRLTPLEHVLLKIKANWVRRTVLKMAVNAKSGHVTTAFSLTELLLTLYRGGILKYKADDPRWPERDRFILSEGQAAIGIYPILADAGFFPAEYLDNFLGENSTLGVHSEPHTPGIEVLTGSLGHGIGIASGMALYAKLKNISRAKRLIICLVGDGELCEGSNWEGFITIQSRNLDNLVLIVNRNHHFTIGRTDSIDTQRDVRLDPLAPKFESFGFEVRLIQGHSFPKLFNCFADLRTRTTPKPLAVIVDTVKGHGSSYFADKRLWHYRVPQGHELKHIEADLEGEKLQLERELMNLGGRSE